MDNIEPIRRAFRNAGLYHHAADDLLCSQLADAAAPPAAERDEAPVDLLAALDAARGEAVAFQKAAGLENTPTEFTLPFRQAVEGTGYLAHEWKDKPHRLIFDLCRYIERNDAAPQPQAEPVGEWVMVPREPTLAMLGAGRAKARDGYTLEAAWEAMLAAAPDRGGA